MEQGIGSAHAPMSSWVANNFALFEASLNGEKKSVVHGVRAHALEEFLRSGFPSAQHEEWRHIDVAPITRQAFSLPAKVEMTAPELTALFGFELPTYRLVFVNGQVHDAVTALPDGVQVASLAEVLHSHRANDQLFSLLSTQLGSCAPVVEQPFVALNTSFMHRGAVICVPKGVVQREPIHLIFISAGRESFVTHPRVFIRAEEQSECTVVEHYVGAHDRYFTNAVTEIQVGKAAVLHHVKMQRESKAAFHVGAVHARVERGGAVHTHTYSFGAALCRNEVWPTLAGEDVRASLMGLTVIADTQQVDNYTVLDHALPRGESNELYKGVYSGSSKGSFNGCIIVRQDAQKTNAIQSNQSLLLSDEATVHTKPQLKIFADDVKCTHGATVGQLDDTALFYLRSRGIPRDEAKRILLRANCDGVVSALPESSLRTLVDAMIDQVL